MYMQLIFQTSTNLNRHCLQADAGQRAIQINPSLNLGLYMPSDTESITSLAATRHRSQIIPFQTYDLESVRGVSLCMSRCLAPGSIMCSMCVVCNHIHIYIHMLQESSRGRIPKTMYLMLGAATGYTFMHAGNIFGDRAQSSCPHSFQTLAHARIYSPEKL